MGRGRPRGKEPAVGCATPPLKRTRRRPLCGGSPSPPTMRTHGVGGVPPLFLLRAARRQCVRRVSRGDRSGALLCGGDRLGLAEGGGAGGLDRIGSPPSVPHGAFALGWRALVCPPLPLDCSSRDGNTDADVGSLPQAGGSAEGHVVCRTATTLFKHLTRSDKDFWSCFDTWVK